MSTLDVSIMGQPFKLSCKDGEEVALEQAVAYLHGKMTAIRDAGKIKGNDRIAVMAALAIAAEMLASKSTQGPFAGQTLIEVNQKISEMHKVIDAALSPQENLF